MAESVLIDGTDPDTYMRVTNIRGLIGNVQSLGGDYATPRYPGMTAGDRWAGSRVLTFEGMFVGSSRADYMDDARALAALVWNDGATYTVTRTIERVSGGDLTTVSTGRYLSGLDSIAQVSNDRGRVSFDIRLLDPYWYASSDTTLSAITTSATPTVAGDVATPRVTLTFSGATAVQRLTNSTTGEWVEVLGNTSADTVLDCLAMTATRSAVSVAGDVAHNSSFDTWLTLAAGSNSLALTGGGQVVVAYRGAYL